MRKVLIAFILALMPVLCFASEAAITISSSNAIEGRYLQFQNNSGKPYASIISLDPNVNRFRVVDLTGKVYYDKKPDLHDSFYLPDGTYQAAAWSGSGLTTDSAVTFDFTDEAPSVAEPVQNAVNDPESNYMPSANSYYNYDYYGLPYYYYQNSPRPYLPPTKDPVESKEDQGMYKNFKPLADTPTKNLYENFKPLNSTQPQQMYNNFKPFGK